MPKSEAFVNFTKTTACLSVRPKLDFGIGNGNQDQVSVLVSEPKFLLPKPKLPPYSFPQIFLMLFVPYFEYFLGNTQLS